MTGLMNKLGRKLISMVCTVVLMCTPAAMATEFFDWEVQPQTVSPGVTAPSSIVPSYFLTDANAGGFAAYAASRGGGTLAVKVMSPLSASTVSTVFNSYHVKYVFADFEGGADLANTATLVSQLNSSTLSKQSQGTFVGQFDLATFVSNPARHTPGGFTKTDYQSTGVNMSTANLYPGQPDLRTAVVTGESTAPNIRSSTFVMPIMSFSNSYENRITTGTHRHVPFMTRFNNWGNFFLDNDGVQNPLANNQFEFVPGSPMTPLTIGSRSRPAISAAATTNQMLSRGDTKALSLHYRLRGANSLILFEPGVKDNPATVEDETYTKFQLQEDVTAGWERDTRVSWVNTVFSGLNPTIAHTSMVGTIDGVANTQFETKGVVWSGVYNGGNFTNGVNKMAILVSNLDGVNHTVMISSLGGHNLLTSLFTVEAGTHRLLEFTWQQKPTRGWLLNKNQKIFSDPGENGRDGVGVPEPATFSVLTLIGCVYACRRPRRQAA